MNEGTSYEEVVNYLSTAIGASLSAIGKEHERVKPYEEARLIDFFERYIYKDFNNYFLIGDSDSVYIYDGTHYVTGRNSEDILLNVIKDSMRRMDVGLVYQKNSYMKIARQCISGMKVTGAARFTPDRDYIVFRNGVLDLKTMALNDFGMDYRTDIVLDFDFKRGYTNPLWSKVICQTIPDGGMRKAFQMFCGAFLINRSVFSIEYICYLIGGGRNGKSVVTGAIAEVFGENLVSSFSLQELLYDNDKQYNRASLVGKIANFSDDVSKKDYSGGAYKQMVSGHKMTARNPYGKPFDLLDIPYLACCVNEMPPTTDDTEGHYRRMLPILCPNRISKEDADEELPLKLKSPDVKAAIINWIIEGREMVMKAKGKIEISEGIKEEIVRIQQSGNSARRWMLEYGLVKVVSPDPYDSRWKPMGDWMDMYNKYCKEMNEVPKGASSVGKIFREEGFESKRRNGRTWWCIGRIGVDTNSLGEEELCAAGQIEEDLPF